MISFNKLAGLFAGLLCFIALNALLIISKPEGPHSNTSSSLAKIASPFYFFTEDETEAKETTPVSQPQEMNLASIVNHVETKVAAQVTKAEEEPVETAPLQEYVLAQQSVSAHPLAATLPLTYVAFIQPEFRQLKDYEQEQVKDALEASKKVLEEKQWKDVEKSIADAMTTSEKDALKGQYEKELSHVDWNNMKQRLSMAYDRIDWNRVNDNLNKELVAIKIDSLQGAYSQTLIELSSIQKELSEKKLIAIPDTDISWESIEENKIKVQNTIKTLYQVKTKKIIHL